MIVVSSNIVDLSLTVSSESGRSAISTLDVSNLETLFAGQLPNVTVNDPALVARVTTLEEEKIDNNDTINGGIIF